MTTTIKKILRLLHAGDKIKLVLLLMMMLLAALLEVVGIGMIPVFISIIAVPDTVLEIEWLMPIWEMFGIENSGDLLVYGSIFLIVVFILKNTYILFYNYIQTRFIFLRLTSIASNLFKLYMYAPYEFHLKRNSAELLRNITNETMHLVNGVLYNLLKIAKDLVLITAIFGMLLWLEPVISIVVFLLLGGGGALFIMVIRERIRKYGQLAQKERANMIRSVNEGLGGFKDARVLGREKWFYKRFFTNIKSFSKAQIFSDIASLANKPVTETIAISGLLFIALLLYWQGRGIESVIPVMTLFGAATLRLMPAIQEMMKAFTTLKYFIFSIDPIYNDTMELKGEARNYHNRSNKNAQDPGLLIKGSKLNFKNEIQFDEASYRYPQSDVEAVKNLTISIPKGYAVGFVGPSGAGKTTLVDMLLGLLEPQHGRITVDNINIHNDISAWKENIGYIPQFIFLADNTIRRNIAFGLPDHEIEEEKLQNAIKAAQLDELVNSLPEGIDTIIGERGTRLSGGQRQRIGIARALYNDPRVLIMDEATSALDNITERYVINAIERLKGERTIVMIAHRLTTVEKCDHLYFMQNGQITDSGTYDQLIARNAEFKNMATPII
ncbi:MAG: ABC transporter ATP-binding protein [Bacteroidales bacterium]